MERLERCEAYGAFNCSSYIISSDPETNAIVANGYNALMRGDNSALQASYINSWNFESENGQKIVQYLEKFTHPLFCRDADLGVFVSPAAVSNSYEVAVNLGLPKKSIKGLPVFESVSFGRDVHYLNDSRYPASSVELGKIFHMGEEEQQYSVCLDVNSLAMHTFITGSTGSGKSNTIYQLLNKLRKKGVHFLVVEPAKGEYKKVFGGQCKVYGTNSTKTELLKMNPFSFPSDIHVLEHIDRLIEIFNACWPMYAAMPAILKDAVEKSYERVGWNLRFSNCNPLKFPTFNDLMETLPEVMNSSVYSADTKNDYAGALITRVRSLTNGISGHIFCSGKELTDLELFDQDVIVDLSRVGSNETKSLMMGILVMKLQEYRLQLDTMNEDLVHVTVLEEAHNLLRRTSVTQSQEGANLQGKSVEMITNSIAEMRTYGEGFIIADQSPELLDEAVIRNTNTKIILRLPNQNDRELVGTSMALNKEQIVELAKLPKGVAAIYQNDWVEAVLCHFERYHEERPLNYTPKKNTSALEKYFEFLFGITERAEFSDEDIDLLQDWIGGLRENDSTLKILQSALSGKATSPKERKVLAYNIFEGKKVAAILEDEADVSVGIENANHKIMFTMGFSNETLVEVIRNNIMDVVFRMNQNGELLQRYRSFEETRRKFI